MPALCGALLLSESRPKRRARPSGSRPSRMRPSVSRPSRMRPSVSRLSGMRPSGTSMECTSPVRGNSPLPVMSATKSCSPLKVIFGHTVSELPKRLPSSSAHGLCALRAPLATCESSDASLGRLSRGLRAPSATCDAANAAREEGLV